MKARHMTHGYAGPFGIKTMSKMSRAYIWTMCYYCGAGLIAS